MAVTRKKAGHAWLTLQLPSPSSWTVLRKSGVSLKCSASQVAREEAHELTCVPAPAEQQCRCSPNKPFASALCIAGRGNSSDPDWLLSPRQDTWWKALDTNLPSQRVAVMHHQMFNCSYSMAFPCRGDPSALLSTSAQVSLWLPPDWHRLSTADQLSDGSAQGDLLFSRRLWIWIALRIPGKSWHIHLKSCLFPACSLNCTHPW